MTCECDFDKAGFGNEIYCKVCGMELGLNPLRKRIGKRTEYYCCESC